MRKGARTGRSLVLAKQAVAATPSQVADGSTAGGDLQATALSELVATAVDHRLLAVPVDRRLRAGALIGLALVVAATVLIGVCQRLQLAAHRPGYFLIGWPWLRWMLEGAGHGDAVLAVGMSVAATGVLAAMASMGFSRAPWWGHVAMFLLVPLGVVASIPMVFAALVTLFNLALWILIGVLAVMAAALALYAVFTAAGNANS